MKQKFVRSLFAVVSFALMLTLFSCVQPVLVDAEIKGVQAQMTAYTGDVFDFLAGITATDKSGKDVTASVKFYTATPMDNDGKLTQSGDYSVRYELEVKGVVLTQEYAMLKVIYKAPDNPGDTMIFNGDFASGFTDPFKLSQFENGTGTFKVESEELVLDVTGIAAAQASPRLDYENLVLDASKFYEVRFEARANVERWMHIQIGELISAAPWFKSVDPIDRFFRLTTTMQEFSFRFQPSTLEGADLSNIALLFEFGKMKEEAILTSCFLDNIEMEEVESLGEDSTAPTITAPTTFKAFIGEKLNIPVTAFDDFDKDVTSRLVVSGDAIPMDESNNLTTEGEYNVIYTVKDTAGNESTVTVVVTVSPARAFADPDNLFGTPSDTVVYDLAGSGSEDNSKANPLKWHIWNIADTAWGIGPATTIVQSLEAGVLSVQITQNENPNFWANQIFYTTLPFETGGQFTFNITINSNKAGKIVVAGKEIDLIVGENKLELPIEVASAQAFTFALQAGTEATGPIGDITLGLSGASINVKTNVEYADPSNLFGIPNNELVYGVDGSGSEVNSKANPSKWHIWNISDAGWGIGPVTTLVPSYVDGVLTMAINQNGNPNFWANQLFYTTLPFETGGQFTLSLKINSSIAGKVTVAGKAVDLVAGDNELEIPISVGSGTAFFFALAAGTEATGPVGDITLVISDVKINQEEDPQYADPQNVLGTIDENSLYQATGLSEEVTAAANPYKFVFWFDQGGWTGAPSNLVYNMVESTLNLVATQPEGSSWFASQVFFKTLPLKTGGNFELSLKINSNKAGKITVNGNVVDIIAGDNEIKVKVTVANEAQFPVTIQLGVDGVGNIGDATVQISNLAVKAWEESGELTKLATPVGLVVNVIDNAKLYTAWAPHSNAVSYKTYIYDSNGVEVKVVTATNGGIIPLTEIALPEGTYTAKLQAIGDGVAYSDSELSGSSGVFTLPEVEPVDPTDPTKLTTPVGFVAGVYEVVNFRTAWAPYANASSFKAYIYDSNGLEVKVVTVTDGGLIPLTELALPAGQYTAKLQAIGDGVNYTNSDLSGSSDVFTIV